MGDSFDLVVTPCTRHDSDLWFGQTPRDVDRAKALCQGCPMQRDCLDGALARSEPWGVWGGQLIERGTVIPQKKRRGRPPGRRSQVA